MQQNILSRINYLEQIVIALKSFLKDGNITEDLCAIRYIFGNHQNQMRFLRATAKPFSYFKCDVFSSQATPKSCIHARESPFFTSKGQ